MISYVSVLFGIAAKSGILIFSLSIFVAKD